MASKWKLNQFLKFYFQHHSLFFLNLKTKLFTYMFQDICDSVRFFVFFVRMVADDTVINSSFLPLAEETDL